MKKIFAAMVFFCIVISNITTYAYDYEISRLSITKNEIEYSEIPDGIYRDYTINVDIESDDKKIMNGTNIIVAQYDENDIMRHCDIVPYEYNENKPFEASVIEKHNDYRIIVKDCGVDLEIASGGGSPSSSTGTVNKGQSSSTIVTRTIYKVCKIKIFIWDSLSNQLPSSEYKEIQ